MIYLSTILIIFVLLSGWLLVQAVTRRFSKRHPELGVEHEEGCGGCMNNCGTKRNSETHL